MAGLSGEFNTLNHKAKPVTAEHNNAYDVNGSIEDHYYNFKSLLNKDEFMSPPHQQTENIDSQLSEDVNYVQVIPNQRSRKSLKRKRKQVTLKHLVIDKDEDTSDEYY